ncbi:agrin-like [Mercenaria mercenaria]|uniref:agrin-like n=1 Tax=Mercenaria mercenaria TaxID=6596 RepID=UPI00234EF408|nr:agrin-like [Mercenaria mercenaria]
MEAPSIGTLFLTFFVFGFVTISGVDPSKVELHKDFESINAESRRFLMTHHSNMPWMSWRQHVACLTTCVNGYEAETVACCTTGDNRLCLNLPFGLLNSSIGSCPDFCQRKSAVNCGTQSDQVCGSNGVTYANMCEFSKAVCDNDALREVKRGPCPQIATPTTTADPIVEAFCSAKNTIVCGTELAAVCSSDRQFYLNKCEFSKAYCNDRKLTRMTWDTCVKDFCQSKSTITCGTQSDQVCGSDGVIYANMCEFSKAVCDNDTLREVKRGPCPQITTPVTTAGVTLDPIMQAFCSNKDAIACGTDLSPICASNGNFYLNSCEYSKAYCDNRKLARKPREFCTGG